MTLSGDVPSASTLIHVLAHSPHDFLRSTNELHSAALALAKRYLDPVATSVSAKQQIEYQETRRKRKHGNDGFLARPLQLKKIHVEGFGVDQVYEQAKRVTNAARNELELAISGLETRSNSIERGAFSEGVGRKRKRPASNSAKTVRFEDDAADDSDLDDNSPGQGLDRGYDGDEVVEDEGLGDGSEAEELLENRSDSEMPSDEEEDLDQYDYDGLDDPDRGEDPSIYVADRNGLNDGFFSIDDFNRNSEFLEQQDRRGDPDDGAASDEEDIDWGADPLKGTASNGKERDGLSDESGEGDEDDDEGPTFGNAMDASDVDEDITSVREEDMQDAPAIENTNNILYADFFAPPAQKASKKKRGRPNPHNFPQKETQDSQQKLEAQEDDIERTVSAVHRDLFDDALSENESDEPLSDADPGDPKSRRSNHERRQAKIAEEIRRLEAANVAKREWTLSGEARAADRPVNSLLEEDLDFERAGKPVPVITQEITEDIEALIKRRILTQEFDEVIRRRPDSLATGRDARRGRQTFELDDSKPAQGLAEEYEREHLRRTDPNYVDVKDEKLKKEHKEIELLWKDISAKLDALSNWHYKPKPAAPNLEIRVDVPTITMEDARPAAGANVGSASMLAPQEIYATGEARLGDDVQTNGGMPMSREEISREQKTSRRRRKKERLRKAGGQHDGKENGKTRTKKAVIGDLKRGGVKVIGRKGEVVDVEGKQVARQQPKSGGSYKL